jgi:hypothetical protein
MTVPRKFRCATCGYFSKRALPPHPNARVRERALILLEGESTRKKTKRLVPVPAGVVSDEATVGRSDFFSSNRDKRGGPPQGI